MNIAPQIRKMLLPVAVLLSLAALSACGTDSTPADVDASTIDVSPAVVADEAAEPLPAKPAPIDVAPVPDVDEAVQKALEAERLEYEANKERLSIAEEET